MIDWSARVVSWLSSVLDERVADSSSRSFELQELVRDQEILTIPTEDSLPEWAQRLLDHRENTDE